jgi:thiosulfate dehydrogenase (quinone) large subunit
MDRTQRQSWTFWSPPGAGALLYRPALGYLWLIVRLYIGWQWLTAGWHKLTGTESIGWVHSGVVNGKAVHSGDKLLAFWRHAVAPAQPGSMPQAGFGWYRAFLHALIDHHTQGWFAPLIAGSEFLVGVLLILGAFTVVAASVGALLNFNYMLAGSASLNPVLFLGALAGRRLRGTGSLVAAGVWLALAAGLALPARRGCCRPTRSANTAAASSDEPPGASATPPRRPAPPSYRAGSGLINPRDATTPRRRQRPRSFPRQANQRRLS